MLGKLLKYEIKATAKTFLPFYGALILLTILNRVFMPLSGGLAWLSGITMFFNILAAISVLVITFIVIIQRYFRNVARDEAYLMFTIPVKTWQFITSKLLTSMIWSYISFLLVALSGLFIALEQYTFAQVQETITAMHIYMGQIFGSVGVFYFEAVVFSLVAVILETLILYTAISIGTLFKNKVLGSFVGYIIIYVFQQALSAMVVLIFSLTHHPIEDIFVNLTSFPHYAVWIYVGILAILSAGYFTVSNYILNKKLNLE